MVILYDPMCKIWFVRDIQPVDIDISSLCLNLKFLLVTIKSICYFDLKIKCVNLHVHEVLFHRILLRQCHNG